VENARPTYVEHKSDSFLGQPLGGDQYYRVVRRFVGNDYGERSELTRVHFSLIFGGANPKRNVTRAISKKNDDGRFVRDAYRTKQNDRQITKNETPSAVLRDKHETTNRFRCTRCRYGRTNRLTRAFPFGSDVTREYRLLAILRAKNPIEPGVARDAFETEKLDRSLLHLN